jgi:hypothetical protein
MLKSVDHTASNKEINLRFFGVDFPRLFLGSRTLQISFFQRRA